MTSKKEPSVIEIKPINLQVVRVPIIGTAPYCQHNFGSKARQKMIDDQISTAKKSRKKPPRDFDADFNAAFHRSSDGWIGIPAVAFRAAMIDACRLIGFKMTMAKMSVFVQHDGLDADTGQPLVRLIAGEPERSEMPVRFNDTVSIAVRPLWREWGAMVSLRFDADQFKTSDVINLLDRAGQQVGVGEGRPFSKASVGLGWGTFMVDASAMGAEKEVAT